MGEMKALERVVDSLDVETFLVCRDKAEGERLGIQLMRELGFQDVDVVSLELGGPGARVRLRANIYKPGDRYAWCRKD
jgi:hypothetical protein